jgi:hypothetical protein
LRLDKFFFLGGGAANAHEKVMTKIMELKIELYCKQEICRRLDD